MLLAQICLVMLAATLLALLALALMRRASGASHGGRTAFILAAIAATANSFLTIAEKQPGQQPVLFPYTDPSARYLFDAGSYVTNDAVHLAFTTLLVPPTGMIYLDCQQKMTGGENTNQWTTAFALPLGSLDLPLDYEWPNATNYSWCCYTDWTPGSQTITNDIFIINWMTARDPSQTDGQPDLSPVPDELPIIPVRTSFFLDADQIITIQETLQ